jgi:hypothetical protein
MNRKAVLAGLALAAMSSTAMAQSTDFVLFGKPSADAKLASQQNAAVHPITAPMYNDDPFVTTDIRLIGIYQSVPDTRSGTFFVQDPFTGQRVVDALNLRGKNVQQYLLQGRLALTSQVQLQVYNLGYTDWNGENYGGSGLNDFGVGVKWNFYQDWGNRLHAAVGAGYELPWGDNGIFQNDDELRLWLSISKGFDRLNLNGTVNVRLANGSVPRRTVTETRIVQNVQQTQTTQFIYPMDGDSTILNWHLHADYYVNKHFSPVLEFNGYHTLSTPTEGQDSVHGMDLGNFGDNTVYTMGIGAEVRPVDAVKARGAIEFPIFDDKDNLMDWRITASVIWSF